MNGYAYLASPYSSPSPQQTREWVRDTRYALAWGFTQDLVMYSPISHWHEVGLSFGLPTDAKSHEHHNHVMQDGARELVVLMLREWRGSKGVQAELKRAIMRGQPIRGMYYAYGTFMFCDVSELSEAEAS